MGELNIFLFLSILFIYFFKYSSEQIIIPLNPINEQNEPTIMTKQTFTVQSNDGTPITVTRIGFHRTSKNLNKGGDRQVTPLDLMRLMDDRINSIFEEIISQRIGLRLILNEINNKNDIKEEEQKTNDNNKINEENNKNNNNENTQIIDDKDLELDGNSNEENKDKIFEQNKTEEIKEKVNKKNQKNPENSKNNEKNKNEKKGDNKTKTIGKLKISSGALKSKYKKKTLSKKEIIFSRICKYIFYSIILFTIYILIRKLLEVLEIIEPETNIEQKDVKVNNNNHKEIKNNDEMKKREDDIILNKKKENNKLN